jgi:hypothetical protein
MLNPRNLLVLLGFFAQGLIWDSYGVLLGLFLLWFVALKFFRNRVNVPLAAEALVLFFGCLLSVGINKFLGYSWHFFLGDGLILLQLLRLVRPLKKREKLTSIIIAGFHFSVLCTLAPNIRFVTLYVAALFLFPGALKEVNSSDSLDTESAKLPEGYRLIPSARVCFWLLLGSAFVFLAFPRFTGTPLQLRESLAEQGSLLDSILDPRNSGKANSKQVLLQIDGDNLGYLRCLALTEFDGIRWFADPGAHLKPLRTIAEDTLEGRRYKRRVVYVKSSKFLGRVLPNDGKTVWVQGNFFSKQVYEGPWGVLQPDATWTTANNVFTNYIDIKPQPEPLTPQLRKRLTYYPAQSDALIAFVNERTASATNLLHKARLLENYLRDNFTYELGTPELRRLQPVDDFIFNRKSGHCERFAASLALMLRMQGIPSRVAVGYVPTSRNLFNGRAQVRFSDAHSWTEGYFDGIGWITFDATPGPPSNGRGSDLMDLFDALDFAWYSHIINFNGVAQHQLFTSTRSILSHVSRPVWNGAASLCLFIILVLLAIKFGTFPSLKFRRLRRLIHKPAPESAARHRYEEMLRILEKRGSTKKQEQTPLEFLEIVNSSSLPGNEDVARITESFCITCYGEKMISSSEERNVKEALDRLKSVSAPS